ncbi:hypothetical protein BHM03_00045390 [Ensete ventricosum]|nr:hypothetical protein BHM03_00045390 [Ensete ventricosum]
MASWEQLGELSTVAQLTGLDAGRLIGLIVQAATTARMHRKNCRQFAQHLKLIGNLLEQLKISELKKYPETREPLEQLEDALRRSYILVDSCQNRSYLYLLAMGWNIVYQFRRAQNEIDRYLRLVPLITLVDNARVRVRILERLDSIARDEREYTLDEEDRKVQDAILDHDPSTNHTTVLEKSLSCSYPNMPFDEALKKEREKLQMELQRSQVNMDIGQCEVIQHLIGVTHNVAITLEEKSTHLKSPKKVERSYSEINLTIESCGVLSFGIRATFLASCCPSIIIATSIQPPTIIQAILIIADLVADSAVITPCRRSTISCHHEECNRICPRRSQHGGSSDHKENSTKRKRQETDPSCPRTRVDFPRWEDGDLIVWISYVERYFHYHRTPEVSMVDIATIHLGREATKWYD